MKLAKMKPGYLVVPYVGAFPDALLKHLRGLHSPFRIACERVDESDDEAYYRTLNSWWKSSVLDGGRDLLIIEHDVWPTQETMDAFVACSDLYCSNPYWLGGKYGIGLGCTRFRAFLPEEHPDLIVNAANRGPADGLGPAAWWKRMDCRIEAELADRKYLPCKHSIVEHRDLSVEHPHRPHYPMRDPISWEADA